MLDNLIARTDKEGPTLAIRDQWRALARQNPDDAGIWTRYAEAEGAAHNRDVALAAFRHVIALTPNDPRPWYGIAGLHLGVRELDEAEKALAHARVTQRDDSLLAGLHAWTLNELGRSDDAAALLDSVASRQPAKLLIAISRALMLPPIYESTESVAMWRTQMSQRLDALAKRTVADFDNPPDIFRLTQTCFHLAYQGDSDIEMQRTYHRWQASILAAVCPELLIAIPQRKRMDKLRVAFVSSDLRRSTIGNYFRAWIERIDRSRFQTTAVMTGPRVDDVTHQISAAADHALMVNSGAHTLASTLRGGNYDVIVYPEIGMNAAFTLLADLRLAPLQIAAWGHPTTTGATAIDAYLTCDMMEPMEADHHYSERLIRLPGIGTYYPAPLPVAAIDRARFGLRPEQNIYCCPQTVFKIHPENDALFVELLRDPNAVLLLFQHESAAVTRALGKRIGTALASAGVPDRSQIKFLPVMRNEQFRSVLAMCDVVLDTLHFSGGNTSLDAIAAGVPLVTWPGRLMRGRQSMAMLNILDLPELVVDSAQSYIDTARRLATDQDANRTIREAIALRRHRLFEQQAPIDSLMDALEAMHPIARPI